MATASPVSLRLSPDALFVALAALHGLALLAAPPIPVIGLGVWWNLNTIAHNFIHRPFFRSRAARRTFSLYLSVLLGIPQTLWRERHLAHHADRPYRLRLTAQIGIEVAASVALWLMLYNAAPRFFGATYLPGWAFGLLLCALQGHYEHAGGTTSHYGRLYNLLCFNDGYHVEHHAAPGRRWTRLPAHVAPGARTSRWPALLRWIDALSLEGLERLLLRCGRLQPLVLRAHQRAFARLLPLLPPTPRIAIVGGGLFPRSALVLKRLAPDARVTIVDQSAVNLRAALSFLDDDVKLLCRRFPHPDLDREGFDLIVIPLSFSGDRERLYRRPPAPAVLVHDWIWRRRGESCVVSPLLLKRLNLVRR